MRIWVVEHPWTLAKSFLVVKINMEGWIKLHRKILDNPISRKPEYAWLWVTLLLKANHKENKFMWNGEMIVVKEGQLITSRVQLSRETGIPETTIERILKVLENSSQIGQQKTTKFRLITVINWKDYQENGQQTDNKRTTNGHKQECNNDKNEKKYTSAKAERLSSLKDSLPNTGLGSVPANPPKSPLAEKERLRILRKLSEKQNPTFGTKATANVVHFCELFLKHKNYPYGSIVNIEPVAKQLSRYYQNGETIETINDMLDSYMQSAKANDITVKLTTAFSEDTYHSWKQGKFSGGNKTKGMAL